MFVFNRLPRWVRWSLIPRPKTAFYAVRAGRNPGVYRTWAEAEAQVKGFGGARFQKFGSEAEARTFVKGGAGPYERPAPKGDGGGGTAGSKRSSRAESPPTSARPQDLPNEYARLADEGYTFSRAAPHRIVVYTDGSSLGNGKHGAAAGAGVFWGGTGAAYTHNIAERVPGPMQTNNRGELLSIIRALEECPHPELPLEVRTDSQYSINCITTWLPGWIKNGWRTSGAAGKGGGVKNADMIRHLLVLLRRRRPGAPVRFKYVKGHAGHEGNEAADKLARSGAIRPPLPDRADWLNPDDPDPAPEDAVPEEAVADGATEAARAKTTAEAKGVKTAKAAAAAATAEIDPAWLMTDDEARELEEDLVG